MSQEPDEPQYKVSDRRRFSPEGEPLESDQNGQSEGQAQSPPARTADAEGQEQASAPSTQAKTVFAETPPLPPASLEMLILSLAMQAQVELGGGGEPSGGPPNLELARHSIDLLSVLQEKTKGNLTLEESRLLENTLTDLRFRYVHRVEEINRKAKT